MEEIREVIARVFRQQFQSAHLVNTFVEADVDHDGDEILRIQFVFDIEEGELDVQKVKSLIRHLREPLEEIKENRFPVINFMTSEEFSGEAA